MSRNRTRPGQTPPIVFVAMAGAILFLIVFAIAMSGGGGNPVGPAPSATLIRTSPDVVDSRVVAALQGNNPGAVYAELSPSLQQSLTLDSFQKTDAELVARAGKVVKIEVLEPLAVLTGADWNGQWAQSKVRITREKTIDVYYARYYLENGLWYLVATIKAP